ncbi:hypothetical protein ACFL6S_16930 [Candidatus Poribacteria bacterium]
MSDDFPVDDFGPHVLEDQDSPTIGGGLPEPGNTMPSIVDPGFMNNDIMNEPQISIVDDMMPTQGITTSFQEPQINHLETFPGNDVGLPNPVDDVNWDAGTKWNEPETDILLPGRGKPVGVDYDVEPPPQARTTRSYNEPRVNIGGGLKRPDYTKQVARQVGTGTGGPGNYHIRDHVSEWYAKQSIGRSSRGGGVRDMSKTGSERSFRRATRLGNIHNKKKRHLFVISEDEEDFQSDSKCPKCGKSMVEDTLWLLCSNCHILFCPKCKKPLDKNRNCFECGIF